MSDRIPCAMPGAQVPLSGAIARLRMLASSFLGELMTTGYQIAAGQDRGKIARSMKSVSAWRARSALIGGGPRWPARP